MSSAHLGLFVVVVIVQTHSVLFERQQVVFFHPDGEGDGSKGGYRRRSRRQLFLRYQKDQELHHSNISRVDHPAAENWYEVMLGNLDQTSLDQTRYRTRPGAKPDQIRIRLNLEQVQTRPGPDQRHLNPKPGQNKIRPELHQGQIWNRARLEAEPAQR